MLIAIYSKDGKTVEQLLTLDEYLEHIGRMELTDTAVFCSLI